MGGVELTQARVASCRTQHRRPNIKKGRRSMNRIRLMIDFIQLFLITRAQSFAKISRKRVKTRISFILLLSRSRTSSRCKTTKVARIRYQRISKLRMCLTPLALTRQTPRTRPRCWEAREEQKNLRTASISQESRRRSSIRSCNRLGILSSITLEVDSLEMPLLLRGTLSTRCP